MEDKGVNIVYIGEPYEIMEGVIFERGTKSWLPSDMWIPEEFPDWIIKQG